ncbi:Succinate-semialdehyde dehydrogenase [Golovinomyces cichoracearum]|uniref:aldehyde dehydrogenase (NAD(+)) n=1 Tax=Golovinomyces cichoracearum TaxID=62708 RepID=A0A420IQE3_9PEZI|nr:Succinate-semialdehyde dehydrogenase [Golovinomyces cichoracearum]
MKMSLSTMTTISPLTNQPVLTRSCVNDLELQQLPQTATEAFLTFSKTPLADRQEIVRKAISLLDSRKDLLGKELTELIGRPISYTANEVSTALKRANYLLKISDDALQDTPGEAEEGFNRYIKKVPVGPVLILFAWNYPYLILINSLIPALLAGNSIILSPSPRAPTIAEHVSSVFLEAGLPQGVIQYIHYASPSQVEVLIRDPRISHICFTGSVANGIRVQKTAAERVVNVCLELGGKDPAYIRSDVDIHWVAEEIVSGSIFNSGQSCCSIERIYVDEEIHDIFVKAMQKVLQNYVMGDPFLKETQIGPVVSKDLKKVIELHIKDAIEKGAQDVTPDNKSFTSFPPHGNFVKPTLLINVTHEMLVMNEETFGPVLPVMSVKDDSEAIRLMNNSEFGLTASIWTRDTEKGLEIANQVDAGTVFLNRCDYPSPDLAWTGWKNSGKGVTLSKFGFDQFVRLKSFHLKQHVK